MPSTVERDVLSVLVDELEQIPVRGLYRPRLEVVIEVMQEMASYRSFEDGRYRTLTDVTDTVVHQRALRAKKKVVQQRLHTAEKFR